MIIANNVYLEYPDKSLALKEINLVIPFGNVIYITGPSGSGKTSFLKLLMGIEKPSSGSLTVWGYDMNKVNEKNLRTLRKNIGPIFQDFKLLNGRTVLDNVLIGMRFLDLSKKEIKLYSIDALKKVGLSHKINSLVDNLSYGERQRVAIARAVARKPSLIIADEPTGNLDKDNSLIILELLKSFRNENTTVIITTHATHLIEKEVDCMKVNVLDGRMSLGEVPYESFV